MENDNNNDSNLVQKTGDDNTGSKKTYLPLVFGVIVLLIAVGGFVLFKSMKKDNIASGNPTLNTQTVIQDVNTVPTTANGDSSITDAGDVAAYSNTSEVVVEGSSFKFTPATFLVSRGQNVKLTFKNNEGYHDLVFDNLDIKIDAIAAGKQASVQFTAPTTAGEYTFFCSIGNHKAMGMIGKMVVE